jgi:hypothetical protein
MASEDKTLSDVLAMLFVVSVSVGLSVCVMMFGWGLQPKSWWWIIGVGIFATTFMRWLTDYISKPKH